MTDILGLIDGAIRDWETSPDAMRWSPEPPPDPSAWRVELNGIDLTPYVSRVELPGLRRLREAHDALLRQRIEGLSQAEITVWFDETHAFRWPRVNVHAIMDPIRAWLTANRITPADVPIDAVPAVVGRRIVCPVYARDRRGRLLVTRLRVPPPEQLREWLDGADWWTARWLLRRAELHRMHVAYSRRKGRGRR